MVMKEVTTTIPPNTAEGAPKRMSMIARKDFRDRFESEKANHEKLFSDLFGGEWSIRLDPSNLFTYLSESDAGVFGFYCNKYFADVQNQDNLKNFAKEFGADGKQQVSALAHTRVVTIEPSTTRDRGFDFLDGKFRIVFQAPDGFTSAASYWSSEFGKQVSDAAAAGPASSAGAPREMSIVAKRDIRDRYEAEIGGILERVRKYLKCPELELDPNFQGNYEFYMAWVDELKADPDETAIRQADKDWAGMIGYLTLKYFARLADWLRDEGFPKDDMLQEGFKEAVSANKVTVKQESEKAIKDKGGNDTLTVIEDGVLVFYTKPQAFGFNEGSFVSKIMDLL